MNLILMMLLDYMNNPHISIVDYTIAKYIVHHYTLIFDISINELADLLEVSISQISRFVRHIGFSSFQEFKEATRYHGENQRHSMIQKAKNLIWIFIKNIFKKKRNISSLILINHH